MEQDDELLYGDSIMLSTLVTVLILFSFIFALTIAGVAFDSLFRCGLVGQIMVGVMLGAPGLNLIGASTQDIFRSLGYVGLVSLAFKGGLYTNIKTLRTTALMSTFIALTNIALSTGISSVLVVTCNASLTQVLAAGCVLGSTSLGVAFKMLRDLDLYESRVGVILTSTAMIGNVFGLALMQLITRSAFSDRDLAMDMTMKSSFVSMVYALIIPLVLYLWKKLVLQSYTNNHLKRLALILQQNNAQHIVQTFLCFLGYSSDARASISALLAAYLAGLLITSLDLRTMSTPKVADVFNAYQEQSAYNTLGVTFFASIGYSVPVRLFVSPAFWRGTFYAMRILFGKACSGLWLIRFSPIRIVSAYHGKSNDRQPLPCSVSIETGSLYSARMLGSAIVAPGEIGFLLLASAQSYGIFRQENGNDKIYSIVTWAILICTVVGPLSFGIMASEMKYLERHRPNGLCESASVGTGHS